MWYTLTSRVVARALVVALLKTQVPQAATAAARVVTVVVIADAFCIPLRTRFCSIARRDNLSSQVF